MAVIGGMPVGPDGRIHTTFTRDASTLRLTSKGPNLQNIPRSSNAWKRLPKQMFVAALGSTFWARDYSGIEAKLVGVAANSKDYTRISGIDVHSYFTAYKLSQLDGLFPASDLPSLSWSDRDLADYLKGIKKAHKADRQALKHVGHLANYMGGAFKVQEVLLKELGVVYPIAQIRRLMDLYFAIFPDIPAWHKSLCLQVDGMRKQRDADTGIAGVCTLTNPYGFPMRFHHVLDWTRIDYTEADGQAAVKWAWDYGRDAKALVAAWPQSTASFIYAEAAMALDVEYPEVGETLRLLIHDELLGECRREQLDECLSVSRTVMERPIPQIPLPPAWGMGPHLVVATEGKVGECWGEMKEVA